VPEQPQAFINVKGQEPVDATAALFSNFLAISRVGTEIQFEFVFLDLNQIAVLVEKARELSPGAPPTVVGKTVAKIVMPGAAFVQLRGQIEKILEAIEQALKKPAEVLDERTRSSG